MGADFRRSKLDDRMKDGEMDRAARWALKISETVHARE